MFKVIRVYRYEALPEHYEAELPGAFVVRRGFLNSNRVIIGTRPAKWRIIDLSN
jgi:hypothetical protein